MDPKESDIEQKDDGSLPDPQSKKRPNYKMWLFLAAVVIVVICSIRFKHKNKPVVPETASPAVVAPIEPVYKYDIYEEIKKFMDKQTRYVMSTR